jgi:hypothetical protein
MSEYLYYEFKILERTLSTQEMKELRAISSRAEITPHSFVNSYCWGDLKADATTLMKKYFDAHLYYSCWCYNKLMLRIPGNILKRELISPYESDCLEVIYTDNDLILIFASPNNDNGDYNEFLEEDKSYLDLDTLLPLREELMRGDLRSLYLSWLATFSLEDDLDSYKEPPAPPGLKELSYSHQELAKLLRLDHDLIAAAAEGSFSASTSLTSSALESSLKTLSKEQLISHLSQLLTTGLNDGPKLLPYILQLREKLTPTALHTSKTKPRSAKVLLEAAKKIETQRLEEQSKAKIAKRQTYLKSLSGKETAMWKEAEKLAEESKASSYDQVAVILTNLRDLAHASKQNLEFWRLFTAFKQSYSRKSALQRRLSEINPL